MVIVSERFVFVLGQGGGSVVAREAVKEIGQQYTGVYYNQDGVVLRCNHIIIKEGGVVGTVVEHRWERWVQRVWHQVCPHEFLFKG
jgi:hypothetical protein